MGEASAASGTDRAAPGGTGADGIDGAVAIGIDVGGTNVRVAGVGPDGAVLARRQAETDASSADATLDCIVEEVDALRAGELPVGIGIAGIVDRTGSLRAAPNLAWRDVDVQGRLEDRLGVPVLARNDASVALWGERAAGAARGVDDVVMLTLGTGVGGGVALEGRLVEGANGLGGELGHVIVLEGGRACPCGNLGCIEAYASGTAIAARARRRLARDGARSSLEGARRVDGAAVVSAAQDGDELALEVVTEAGRWLGVALASLVNAFDPELVVVGGGAGAAAFDLLVEPARQALADRVLGGTHRDLPDLVVAQLGDDAGIVGAATLAAQRHGR